MNMTVRNALFKKKAIHQVNHKRGPSETRVFIAVLVRENQRGFLRDIEVLSSDPT